MLQRDRKQSGTFLSLAFGILKLLVLLHRKAFYFASAEREWSGVEKNGVISG